MHWNSCDPGPIPNESGRARWCGTKREEALRLKKKLRGQSIATKNARRDAVRAAGKGSEMQRMFMENCNDLVFSLSPAGLIVCVSPSCFELMGLEPRFLKGKRFSDFVHSDDLPAFQDYITCLLSEPSFKGNIEYRIRHADGYWAMHATSASVVRTRSGAASLLVGIARDITKRVLYEREAELMASELRYANAALMEAYDIALEASRARGLFLANISHEIRTPLNGVMGMAGLLLDRALDMESADIARTIQSSGESLLQVVNDILDYSNIESGKLGIELVPVCIEDLVKEVCALYRGHAEDRRLALTCQTDYSGPSRVLADRLHVRQVLSSFVGNALKFTREGEVVVEWNLTDKGHEVLARIGVRDTGTGIPEEKLAAVFESFTQADNSTRREYGGAGLGLAISKSLVDLMGGQIGVESIEGKGSYFWMELRLKRVEEPPVAISAPTNDTDFSGSRVLLAEDHPVNEKVAVKTLQRLGFDIQVVHSGLGAITMATTQRFDLILMDVQMPFCDGLEATQAIRQNEIRTGVPRHTIIALTANATPEDRTACLEAGMDDFLTKPFSAASLKALLARWLNKSCDRAA